MRRHSCVRLFTPKTASRCLPCDYVGGNEGEDELYDGSGLDEVYGGADNDFIYAASDGYTQADYLAGKLDVFYGGGGTDLLILQGGVGNILVRAHIAIDSDGRTKKPGIIDVDKALIIEWKDSGGVINRDIISETVELIQIGNSFILTSELY